MEKELNRFKKENAMFRNLSHMEKLNFDADIISDLIDKCEKEYLDLEEFKMKDASI